MCCHDLYHVIMPSHQSSFISARRLRQLRVPQLSLSRSRVLSVDPSKYAWRMALVWTTITSTVTTVLRGTRSLARMLRITLHSIAHAHPPQPRPPVEVLTMLPPPDPMPTTARAMVGTAFCCSPLPQEMKRRQPAVCACNFYFSLFYSVPDFIYLLPSDAMPPSTLALSTFSAFAPPYSDPTPLPSADDIREDMDSGLCEWLCGDLDSVVPSGHGRTPSPLPVRAMAPGEQLSQQSDCMWDHLIKPVLIFLCALLDMLSVFEGIELAPSSSFAPVSSDSTSGAATRMPIKEENLFRPDGGVNSSGSRDRQSEDESFWVKGRGVSRSFESMQELSEDERSASVGADGEWLVAAAIIYWCIEYTHLQIFPPLCRAPAHSPVCPSLVRNHSPSRITYLNHSPITHSLSLLTRRIIWPTAQEIMFRRFVFS